MRFGDFHAFIKYSWIFIDRATAPDFYVDFISDMNLMDGTQRHADAIPLQASETELITDLTDWLSHKKNYVLTMKEFFTWMRW